MIKKKLIKKNVSKTENYYVQVESMVWSLKLVGITVQAIHSLTFAYLFYVSNFEQRFKIITNDTKDLIKIMIVQKNAYMRKLVFSI